MNLKKLFRNLLLVLGIGLGCSSHAMIKSALNELEQLMRIVSSRTYTEKELDEGFIELQIKCLEAMGNPENEVEAKISPIKKNLRLYLNRGKYLSQIAQKSVKDAILKLPKGNDRICADDVTDYCQHLSFALKTLKCKKNEVNDPKRYVSTEDPSFEDYKKVFLYQCRRVYPYLIKNPTSDLINLFITLTLFAWVSDLSTTIGSCFSFDYQGVTFSSNDYKPVDEDDNYIVINEKEVYEDGDFDYDNGSYLASIDANYFVVKNKNIIPMPFQAIALDRVKLCYLDSPIQNTIKEFLKEKKIKCIVPIESFEKFCGELDFLL